MNALAEAAPVTSARSAERGRRATDNISLKRLTLMSAVVFCASIPHWGALPVWIPMLLAASIGWRLAAHRMHFPLPNRPMRILMACLALGMILLQFRTINGLTAGSALLVVMVSLKFLESRSQRDQLVLILISYFLVFSGLLYEDTVLSGVYLLLFVWMTTVGLMQLGRRGDLMRNRVTTVVSGRLLLQAVPFMLVLFILFPRLPGPLWSAGLDTPEGSTGLSDSMSPGDITNLGLSDEIAFRVDFQTDTPAAQYLYWRGPVLSVFDGRTWTPREGMWGNAHATLRFSGAATRYAVTLEPGSRRWAFALDMPSEWSSERRRNLVMRSDYQLVAFGADSLSGRFDYEVTSHVSYVADEPLNDIQRAVYLRLPAGFNPRTAELMNELRAQSQGDREIIERALALFSTEEFFYTLTPPELGRDSVDDFLFSTREGFCEHYASAFAVMMRLAGIPARVVTGYHGGELNPFGRYFIVRENNAHAWTEVWLADAGWVRVDPVGAVAPERIALGIADGAGGGAGSRTTALGDLGWARRAALAWDAVNSFWNDWIVDYGPALQRNLLERLGFGRLRRTEMLALSAIAAVCLVLFTALYLAWRAHSRERVDAAARLFGRFVRRLQRAGVPAPGAAEDPAAYGRRAATALPRQAGEIASLVALYLRARYERDPGGANLARLRTGMAEFRPDAARA